MLRQLIGGVGLFEKEEKVWNMIKETKLQKKEPAEEEWNPPIKSSGEPLTTWLAEYRIHKKEHHCSLDIAMMPKKTSG